VRRGDVVPRHRDVDDVLTVEERVDGLAPVPAGDDHGLRAERVKTAGELGTRSRSACERLGLHQVGRDHGGEREEPGDERVDGVLAEEAGPRAGDHHGVDDERRGMRREILRDGLDDRRGEKHSRLCAVDADVREDRVELSDDELRRHLVDGRDACRVLCGERDDGAHAVTACCRECLQVGLDAGTAAGIRPGDRQTARNAHGANVTPPDRQEASAGNHGGAAAR
jgi:hypothetical protein